MTATPARVILDVVVLGMLLFAAVAVILFQQRVRFSLASVMLGVLLAALLCGALAWNIRTVTLLKQQYQAMIAREQALRLQEEAQYQEARDAVQAELRQHAESEHLLEQKLERLRTEHQDALTKLKTLEGEASREDRRAGSNP
jgi:hypothetical protein